MSVIVETSIGDLEIDLFVDKAPQISKNFLKLCKIKHYNNALFSEVQKNYLTQITTTPASTIYKALNKEGQEYIPDEINPNQRHNDIGILSTNNQGKDKNNSEFFITLTDSHLQHFDEKHTIFGKVQVGIEVLEKFNTSVIVDNQSIPYVNIRILHTIIIDDPFEDPEGLDESNYSSPSRVEISDNNRLEYHEKERLMKEDNKTEEEAIEEAKAQIAKVREIKLQILGDIPDADMKPPENVLFVCQLNAITQERDLEIIFSRFGVINRCEVVRDWKTGESLQYAFIEFETEKSCQEAYFKMKGSLIDERRIHVDFSQSLQKMKNNRRNPTINKKPQGKNDTGIDKLEFSKFYRGERRDDKNHKMMFEDLPEESYEDRRRRKEQDSKYTKVNDSTKQIRENKSDKYYEKKERSSRSEERRNKRKSYSQDRKIKSKKSRSRERERHKNRSRSRSIKKEKKHHRS